MDIKTLRKEYSSETLSKKNLHKNPFNQLKAWIKKALDLEIVEANAMVLATATKEGRPSTRTVLLKEIDERGLIFYTSYTSQKAIEIAQNPHVSLTIYWKELEKQITIDGIAEKISEKASDHYFNSRPRKSQIGAWSSNQGAVIASRKILEEQYFFFDKKFKEKPIPRPDYWGGYRVLPERFIFWQGRQGRMHDRFLYQKEEGTWSACRVSP